MGDCYFVLHSEKEGRGSLFEILYLLFLIEKPYMCSRFVTKVNKKIKLRNGDIFVKKN